MYNLIYRLTSLAGLCLEREHGMIRKRIVDECSAIDIDVVATGKERATGVHRQVPIREEGKNARSFNWPASGQCLIPSTEATW